MDLCGVLVVPHIHPEARNTRDVRPARIGLEPQHIRVKLLGLGHVVGTFANANAMVMQFEYFDGHGRSSLTDEQSRGVVYDTPDFMYLFCLQTGRDSSSFSPMSTRRIDLASGTR